MEAASGMKLREVRGQSRAESQRAVKELFVYVGGEWSHLTAAEIAERLGIDPTNVGRGYERARQRMEADEAFRNLVKRILAEKMRSVLTFSF